MRPLVRSKRNRTRRFAVAAVSTAAAVLGVTTAAPAVPATPAASSRAVTSTDLRKDPLRAPFLFKYAFNGHLKIGGGYFTMGGRVALFVRYNNGTVAFSRVVIAQPHPITPGGTIYVETTLLAPCAPFSNAYAQAYDYNTRTWTATLPVTVCVRFD
ncbi:hypothetical protein [Streptantibioticus ferralitis]|uniref:Secreted protein n=1 Tax=Streptantibioticus ferralitis TaxID=236510 RepID=A0ABT5Z951_9ACTN|nr:hypothetical protein [Streptantibioticus ferralitis]MDF2259590.1 hypothetical protein [Streptantibioticus ferralitis]